jgi:Trypsin
MKSAQSALKYAKVEFITSNQCRGFFNQQYTGLTSEQFCANIHSNDTEYSPFIGAVILQSDNQRQYTLKGFTSTEVRREQAFDESKPYIFTDVEGQLDWIRTAIGDIMNGDGDSGSETELRECQLQNDVGRCVIEQHCTLYRDAPKPWTPDQEALFEELKCATGVNGAKDGVCCPEKYVNQTETESHRATVEGHQNLKLVNSRNCGQVESVNRIVGGHDAGLREFPWYALIKYKYSRLTKFSCGGSLISSRYVLTCAHCITNLKPGFKVDGVRLGEYDLRTDPDCLTGDNNEKDCNLPVQDIEIELLIPHEKYNNPKYNNDIGLIRLAREATLNQGAWNFNRILYFFSISEREFNIFFSQREFHIFSLTERI